MATQELIMLMEMWVMLRQQESEIVAQKELIAERIKKLMDEEGVTTMKAGDYTAHYPHYWEHKFDSKAFQRDHADLYEDYRMPNPKCKFYVD